MLINRTIKNPQEKLVLIAKFIKENNLYDELFNRPKKGIFKYVFVELDIVCKALGVKPNVLLSWDKGYFKANLAELQIKSNLYALSNIESYKATKPNDAYVPLNVLISFLFQQYNLKAKNGNDLDRRDQFVIEWFRMMV